MKKYIVALMSLFLMFYLSGCGSGSGSTSDSNKTQVTNKPPLAIAGADKIVQEGTSITLDASKSTDSDGNIIKYEWFENNTLLGNTKTLTKVFTKGIHEITLKVTDNKNASSTDSIKVTVKEKVNAKPIATSQSLTTYKNITINITLSATDSNLDSLTYKITTSPTNGTLSGTAPNIIYTPQTNFIGNDSFTFQANDTKDNSNVATISINIEDIDTTPPTATITPANMATNVSLNTNVKITFSEQVKGIDDKNITLSKAGSTIPLAYTLTNNNNTTLTLNPEGVFEFNKDYTLTIKNIKDNAGNVIAPTTSTFTTMPQPTLNGKYLKTGQTTCYDYDTNKTKPCTQKHKGQDGYYKKGVDRSYTRKELSATAGIVIDNATGLMWQDEEYTQEEDKAFYDEKEIGKVQHWVNAKTYCDNLTYGGYTDWRLPNINELKTIVDYGKARNRPTGSLGAINPIFKYVGQVGSSPYWSSTTLLSDPAFAWVVHFDDGHDNWDDKSNTHYVRCVR